MLQDIGDKKFDCVYKPDAAVKNDDYILIYDKRNILFFHGKIPTYAEIKEYITDKHTYLFSIDETAFYLGEMPVLCCGADFVNTNALRKYPEKHLAFAGVTGLHLYTWYKNTKFCGACGSKLSHKKDERAMLCPECGNIIFPYMAVAIIVGVTNGDKILLTKYAGRDFTEYALIAGFTEPGESLEATVRREVFEETGLKIKNIKYYGNQPWGYSQSTLVGFFAELDGDNKITLDTNELSEGVWVNRKDVPDRDHNVSLTAQMMRAFKLNEI